MAKFENSLFTNDDFLQIENVLYTPREEELPARRAFRVNSSFAPYANEVGYDYYDKEGSAKIIATGGAAKDIPFVGEKGGRVTHQVHTIATGIRWTKAERMAINAERTLGKGPVVQLDTLRVETARRFVFEKESSICFIGDSKYNIKGVFHDDFYGTDLGTKENVAEGATGANAAAKRLWSNKTPQEILTDLRTGLAAIEADGLFTARVLMLPPDQYSQLRRPYSDESPMTILTWLQSQGMFFDQIIKSRQLRKTINGDTVDYFMIFDNDPMVVEMAVVEDIMMEDPVYDIVGTMEQAITLRSAGVMLRHPAGFYIGKGI